MSKFDSLIWRTKLNFVPETLCILYGPFETFEESISIRKSMKKAPKLTKWLDLMMYSVLSGFLQQVLSLGFLGVCFSNLLYTDIRLEWSKSMWNCLFYSIFVLKNVLKYVYLNLQQIKGKHCSCAKKLEQGFAPALNVQSMGIWASALKSTVYILCSLYALLCSEMF